MALRMDRTEYHVTARTGTFEAKAGVSSSQATTDFARVEGGARQNHMSQRNELQDDRRDRGNDSDREAFGRDERRDEAAQKAGRDFEKPDKTRIGGNNVHMF